MNKESAGFFIDLFSDYPYFFTSMFLFLLFFLCFAVGKKQRTPILLSAILSAPYGFLSIFFVPMYWNPTRLFLWGGAGIEDIVFSFSNGGIVWFLAAMPFRNNLVLGIEKKRMFLRYTVVSISGISLGLFFLYLIKLDPMVSTLLGIVIIAIILLLLQFDSWRLLCTGAVLFGLLYTLICCIAFSYNPEFLAQWNIKTLSNHYFLGVPVEEIAWSIAFGATWPVFTAYCFNAKIKVSKKITA